MLILCVTIFLPTTVSTGLQGMPCQLESQVHSTNTLIDEVGLVEMEVGLDQLTWGDADLQRELRRLKDNSLKIPNLKYIFKIALLGVIPTLAHYSDIVSDISSGRICGIYVLTYYLTFFSEILFDILSGILSGIYSDILSGIYYILILPGHEFGLGVLLFAWINANGLNIHQMLVSHVCTQWLPLPLIPQNGQVLNLRVGPEKFSGYWKNRTLAQGLKKDVGGRFRYAVGLQSWVNGPAQMSFSGPGLFLGTILSSNIAKKFRVSVWKLKASITWHETSRTFPRHLRQNFSCLDPKFQCRWPGFCCFHNVIMKMTEPGAATRDSMQRVSISCIDCSSRSFLSSKVKLSVSGRKIFARPQSMQSQLLAVGWLVGPWLPAWKTWNCLRSGQSGHVHKHLVTGKGSKVTRADHERWKNGCEYRCVKSSSEVHARRRYQTRSVAEDCWGSYLKTHKSTSCVDHRISQCLYSLDVAFVGVCTGFAEDNNILPQLKEDCPAKVLLRGLQLNKSQCCSSSATWSARCFHSIGKDQIRLVSRVFLL